MSLSSSPKHSERNRWTSLAQFKVEDKLKRAGGCWCCTEGRDEQAGRSRLCQSGSADEWYRLSYVWLLNSRRKCWTSWAVALYNLSAYFGRFRFCRQQMVTQASKFGGLSWWALVVGAGVLSLSAWVLLLTCIIHAMAVVLPLQLDGPWLKIPLRLALHKPFWPLWRYCFFVGLHRSRKPGRSYS